MESKSIRDLFLDYTIALNKHFNYDDKPLLPQTTTMKELLDFIDSYIMNEKSP